MFAAWIQLESNQTSQVWTGFSLNYSLELWAGWVLFYSVYMFELIRCCSFWDQIRLKHKPYLLEWVRSQCDIDIMTKKSLRFVVTLFFCFWKFEAIHSDISIPYFYLMWTHKMILILSCISNPSNSFHSNPFKRNLLLFNLCESLFRVHPIIPLIRVAPSLWPFILNR